MSGISLKQPASPSRPLGAYKDSAYSGCLAPGGLSFKIPFLYEAVLSNFCTQLSQRWSARSNLWKARGSDAEALDVLEELFSPVLDCAARKKPS